MKAWRWLADNKDQIGALLTFLGVLVAGVYAFLTWRLWQATRQQAETTNRIFEAANRPYVEVRIEEGSRLNRREYYLIRFSATAHGPVPAFLTGWTLVISNEGEELLRKTSGDEWRQAAFPGKPVPQSVQSVSQGPDVPRPPAVTGILTVSYRGPHGTAYQTQATFRQDPHRWTLLDQQLTE